MKTELIFSNPSILAALEVASTKKDDRQYLNGILFTDQWAVATDGYTLLAYNHQQSVEKDVIAPVSLFSKLVKRQQVQIAIEDDKITVTQNNTTKTDSAIDGKYPDWRRLFPATLTGETAQFSAKIYEKLCKICKLLEPKADEHVPYIHHNGSGVAVVSFADNALLGLAMPYNTGDKVPEYCPPRIQSNP